MFDDPKGPIEHFSWAKYIIQGKTHFEGSFGNIGKGKDIKIIGTDVTKWKERKNHVLTEESVISIFAEDVDVLIIGNGVNGAINLQNSTNTV